MKISKIKDVKTPERGTFRSAGIDFFVPNDFKAVQLQSGKHIKIGSGIRAEIPSGYMLCAFNKSGVALAGLSVGACVIDEDYTGEISLHLFNETDGNIDIKPGQKLVQFILIPVLYDTIEIVDDTNLHTVPTERGAGGFGSTGDGLKDKKFEIGKVYKYKDSVDLFTIIHNHEHLQILNITQNITWPTDHRQRDLSFRGSILTETDMNLLTDMKASFFSEAFLPKK